MVGSKLVEGRREGAKLVEGLRLTLGTLLGIVLPDGLIDGCILGTLLGIVLPDGLSEGCILALGAIVVVGVIVIV
jgi:hypothetical protein